MLQHKPAFLPSYPASPRLGGNLSPSNNFPKNIPEGSPKKNPSLPNFPVRTQFPANVLNIYPKSRRTSTLKIFKVKIQEEKEFEKLSHENQQMKSNAYMHEIKRKDPKSAVEALVEKSKVDYQKKKMKNNTGSMYINDLWGKRYEVNVRRQARIDAEIRKEEDFKRKPIQVKLDEAQKLFEKKFNGIKTPSQSKALSPENYYHPGPILTERDVRYETEGSLMPPKTLLTEPREEYEGYIDESISNHTQLKLLPKISHSESATTSMSITFDGPKTTREQTLPDSFSRLPEKSKFALVTEAYFPEEKILLSAKGGKKSNFMPSLSPRGFELSKRKTIMEKQLALGDILDRCEFEKNEVQGWTGRLHELRTVYHQKALEKKKRNEELKKEQRLEFCKDSFEKISSRKKYE